MWKKLARRSAPFRSADYWQERYRSGRGSGAGSVGRLAAYKADFVNDFVSAQGVASVIEFGMGDGDQASLFRFPDYTGLDIVPQVVANARKRFADRPGWRFQTLAEYRAAPAQRDLALSLDVIYHLVEDAVFADYMALLVAAAGRFLLVYSSDHEAAGGAGHVRHRAYSAWMAAHAPAFAVAGSWDNPFALAEGGDPLVSSFARFRLYQRRAEDAR